jgi:hypothetical protein
MIKDDQDGRTSWQPPLPAATVAVLRDYLAAHPRARTVPTAAEALAALSVEE